MTKGSGHGVRGGSPGDVVMAASSSASSSSSSTGDGENTDRRLINLIREHLGDRSRPVSILARGLLTAAADRLELHLSGEVAREIDLRALRFGDRVMTRCGLTALVRDVSVHDANGWLRLKFDQAGPMEGAGDMLWRTNGCYAWDPNSLDIVRVERASVDGDGDGDDAT